MKEIKNLIVLSGNILAGSSWYIIEADCPYCGKGILLVRVGDIKYCPYCGEKVSDYAVRSKEFGIFEWDENGGLDK